MRNDSILYCHTSDCVKTFLSEAALENHMLLNKHSYSLTGLDQVKQICINRVTNASELNCSFQDNLSVNTLYYYIILILVLLHQVIHL